MKKTFFTVLAVVLTLPAFATLHVLDNDPNSAPQYHRTFVAAQSAASAGDTIIVHGSNTPYDIDEITKPLTLIGPGYYLGQIEPNEIASNHTAIIGNNIKVSSDNVNLIGLNFRNAAITVEASNVTISRSFLGSVTFNTSFDVNEPNHSLTNFVIENNVITGGVNCSARVSNIVIRNNILSFIGGASDDQQPMLIDHNTFTSNSIALSRVQNSAISSNIFVRTSSSESPFQDNSNSFSHNVSVDGNLPTGNGNQNNVDCADIFLYARCHRIQDMYLASNDSHSFVLSTTSSAIGTGANGTDVGATGGATPYVEFGLPAVPLFRELHADGASSSNSLNVEFRVTTQQ